MRNYPAILLIVAAACCQAAQADVLWDQAPNLNANGFFNSISGSPPLGVTSYAVGDVTVPAGGWTVNSVTMYFSNLNGGAWTSTVTQGRLYVQSVTGTVPTVLPSGALISVTATSIFSPTYQQSYYAVTASGLNLNLAPGSYWIGLTPAAASGPFGPEIGLSASTVLNQRSATIQAGSTSWSQITSDAAITVQGIPTPGASAMIGLGGLCLLRRRRS